MLPHRKLIQTIVTAAERQSKKLLIPSEYIAMLLAPRPIYSFVKNSRRFEIMAKMQPYLRYLFFMFITSAVIVAHSLVDVALDHIFNG